MGKWIKKKPVKHTPRCACGRIGVKKYIGCSWSCQRCLDLDQFVAKKHMETKLTQGTNNGN